MEKTLFFTLLKLFFQLDKIIFSQSGYQNNFMINTRKHSTNYYFLSNIPNIAH